MGVIRAQPARVTDWAAKSVGAAWRAFDLQLTTYAVLLVAVGLVMAYTNSVEDGVVPLEAGTTFSRGLMWAAIAAVVSPAATRYRARRLAARRLSTRFPSEATRRSSAAAVVLSAASCRLCACAMP